jgi:hypothetical protein
MARRTPTIMPARRGTSIAALMLMLAVMNLAVVSVVTATSEEVVARAMSLDSTRALYAVDSGVVYAVKAQSLGLDLSTYANGIPFAISNADSNALGQQASVSIVRGPAKDEPGGELVVKAQSRTAVRRVETEFWVR